MNDYSKLRASFYRANVRKTSKPAANQEKSDKYLTSPDVLIMLLYVSVLVVGLKRAFSKVQTSAASSSVSLWF